MVAPAYNERDRLDHTLDTVVAHLDAPDGRWDGWEIVVVDDGSTDGTAGLVTAREDPGSGSPGCSSWPRSRTPRRCGRPYANWWARPADGWTEYGYGTCTGRDVRERHCLSFPDHRATPLPRCATVV
ncbi:glycosyltransferase [Streptomyces nigra]|uniref:glycosyltransferase n=1 Tax=Streptomyces nigra TaxID=1827580 RepID=UPI003680175A